MRTAIIGCGTIGSAIADAIERGLAGYVELVMVYDIDRERAEAFSRSRKIKAADSFEEIYEDRTLDLVIEAAGQEAVREYIPRVIRSGKNVLVMSVGAFADQELFEKTKSLVEEKGLKLFLPSGAIVGLDGVKAAAAAGLDRVTITSTKPPRALEGAPYIIEHDLNLSTLKEATQIYEGPAVEAVRLFPKNVNVAAALSLAGIGLHETKVRIVVDPNVSRNIHEIQVEGNFGKLTTRVENVPSPENPKTSWLAALSAFRKLREITESVSLGT